MRSTRALTFVIASVAVAALAGELALRSVEHPPFVRSLAHKFRSEGHDGDGAPPRYPFVHFARSVGYRLTPGRYTLAVNDVETTVAVSEQGLRESREYATDVPRGVHRVATLGCSFTFGYGVEEPETWPSRLEAELADTEVLNLGVLGYGQDQSLLLVREDGPWANAEVLVLGFVPRTGVRNVSEVSPFAGVAFPKPHFELDGEVLALVGAPETPEFDPAHYDEFGRRLGWLGRASSHSLLLDGLLAPGAGRLADDEGAIDALTLRILLEMRATVEDRGGRFLVLFLPERGSLCAHRDRAGDAAPLLAALRAIDVQVVDPAPALAAFLDEHDEDGLFAPDGQHPGARYHEIAAHAVAVALRG